MIICIKDRYLDQKHPSWGGNRGKPETCKHSQFWEELNTHPARLQLGRAQRQEAQSRLPACWTLVLAPRGWDHSKAPPSGPDLASGLSSLAPCPKIDRPSLAESGAKLELSKSPRKLRTEGECHCGCDGCNKFCTERLHGMRLNDKALVRHGWRRAAWRDSKAA